MSSEPNGGSKSEPDGGDPGITSDSGAAGVGGEVGSAVAITEPSLPSGKTSAAYSATISATGARTYAWSITSGVLPAGLTLTETTSADVKIEGTPSEAGLFPITLSVTDGTSTAEIDVTVAITHAVLFLSDRDVPGVNELYLSEIGNTTAPTPVRLNASLPNGGGVQSYAWSPDASKVLYIAKQSAGGAPELWVASVATPGTAKRVSAAGTTVSLMTWLGKGNIAAYMTSVGDAYLADLSGSTPGASKLAAATALLPYAVFPSPNGSALGVVVQDTSNGVYTVNYVSWAGGSPTSVPLDMGSLSSSLYYSHDGKYGFIVTQSDGSGDWFDLSSASPTARETLGGSWNPLNYSVIWGGLAVPNGISVGTVNGVNLEYYQIVKNSPCASLGPSWSPDGKHVVFSGCKDVRAVSNVGNSGVNADFSLLSGDFSTSAANASLDVEASAWSPDVGWLALRADRDINDRYDLYLTRWAAPGTIYKPHANSAGSGVSTLAFAPNSLAIAFVATIAPQTNAELYLTQLPSSGAPAPAKQLSESTSIVQTDLNWLPGSRALAYRAKVAGKPQLFAVSFAQKVATANVTPVSGASGSGVSSYQLAPPQ